MKNLFLLLFIAINCSIYGQTIEQLEKKYGYKEIKLDIPLSDLKVDLYYKTPIDVSGYDTYIIDDENYYRIGDTKIDNVSIQTIDNKIYRIVLELSGEKNIVNLIKTYVSAFGNPTYINEDEEGESEIIYHWQSNIITLSIIINLSLDNDKNVNYNGFVMIYSKKMFELDKKINGINAIYDL